MEAIKTFVAHAVGYASAGIILLVIGVMIVFASVVSLTISDLLQKRRGADDESVDS
jgi:hypothetical protein